MIYFLFLLLGCIAFSVYDKQNLRNTYIVSVFYLSPFVALWIFIVGGQLNVGTDYETYLRIFMEKNAIAFYSERYEYVFSSLVSFFQSLGFYGQFYFFLFATITVLIYIQISRRLTNSHYALFFFLFVTVSTLFHNQMNGLRQCIAVYFVTLSIIEFVCNRKLFAFILLLLAVGFHISAFGILLLFFFVKNVSFSPRLAVLGILVVSLCSFGNFDRVIVEVVANIPRYSHYIDSEYFEGGVNSLNKFTKLIYMPIYLCSVSLLSRHKLSGIELQLFQLGLLSYFIRTLSVVSSITNRFGFYFYVLSLLPIFYYLREIRKNRFLLFICICAYILFIYLLKVIVFPVGEYTYSSVFSNYF